MTRQELDKTNAIRVFGQRRVRHAALEYDPAIDSATEVADPIALTGARVVDTVRNALVPPAEDA